MHMISNRNRHIVKFVVYFVISCCLARHYTGGYGITSAQYWAKFFIYSVLLTVIVYFFNELLVKALRKFSLENILLALGATIYSLYAIFFSNVKFAILILIAFSLVSMVVALKNSLYNRVVFIKGIFIFLLLYSVMSYLSIFITTDLANLNYLNSKMPFIVMACLMPIGFFNIKNFNFDFFKGFLSLLLIMMAVFIILLNSHILDINNVKVLSFVMMRDDWTQKNYMFWYVLLTFGALSFYNVRKKLDFTIIISLLLLSFGVIFFGYSDSAKLSFIVGILIYSFFSIFKIQKKYLLALIWMFVFYVLFAPLLFSLIDLAPYDSRLIQRNAIYHTAAALIKEHWLFGYGYGSTLTIELKNFVSSVDLPKYYISAFPGGHPHNLSLLFWLEFGVFGALFLGYFVHKMLAFVVEQTYGNINQAAIFAMIIVFDILTSFSWDIWYPQVLLTYAFFGILLVLSINIKDRRAC